MRGYLLCGAISVLFFSTHFSFSNTLRLRQDSWYEGYIITAYDSVIPGKLNVKMDFDAAVVRIDGQELVFPSNEIKRVVYYDPSLETPRTFQCIRDINKGWVTSRLYEIVMTGQIQLVSRPIAYKSGRKSSYGEKTDSCSKETEYALNHKYYFFDGKTLLPIRNFRKAVLPIFSKYYPKNMAEFVNKHNLNINRFEDQLQIVKHFNLLYAQDHHLVLK